MQRKALTPQIIKNDENLNLKRQKIRQNTKKTITYSPYGHNWRSNRFVKNGKINRDETIEPPLLNKRYGIDPLKYHLDIDMMD